MRALSATVVHMAPVQRLGDVTTDYITRARARAFLDMHVALAFADGLSGDRALKNYEARNGRQEIELVSRALVPAQSIDSIGATRTLANAFLAAVAPKTILGRLVGMRMVPANKFVPATSQPAAAGWVGEGLPAPITRLTTATITIPIAKLAIPFPFSAELLRLGGDVVTRLFESDFQRAISLALDSALLDGAAAVAGLRPASILHGLTSLNGGSPVTFDEGDVTTLALAVASGYAYMPYFVCSPAGAWYLASLRTSGVKIFPDVTAAGGSINGVPVLVSPAAGNKLALIDATSVLCADEGLVIDGSRHSTLEMLNSGMVQSGDTGTGTSLVSLWQSGVIVLRGTRFVSWALGRVDGAAYVELPV
jgi:HK97 family phage major capsid protein